VCIGIQPVANVVGAGEIYDELNRVFTNSHFAMVGETDDFATPGSKSKRAVDRWPMFYFQVDVRQEAGKGEKQNVEQLLAKRYRVEPMVDLLKEICHSFLKRHHYQPRELLYIGGSRRKRPSEKAKRTASRDAAPTELKGASSLELSPFDTWTKIKRGQVLDGPTEGRKSALESSLPERSTSKLTASQDRRPRQAPEARKKIFSDSGILLQPPFMDVPALQPRKDEKPVEGASKNIGALQTTSPNETPSNAAESQLQEKSVTGNAERARPVPVSSLLDAPLSKARITLASKPGKQSEWVANILKSWENPVFEPAELPCHTILPNYISRTASHRCSTPIAGRPSASVSSRIHREALKKADVVGQLDKKFILTKVPIDIPDPDQPSESTDNPTLLLVVDQHAADERCRIEDLMKSYFQCGVATTEPLQAPIHFEVSPREGILFRRFRTHFEHWGIFYESVETPSSHNVPLLSKMRVTSLPPSILERCRQEPGVLIDLLRDEIHALEDRGNTVSTVSTGSIPPDWVAAFRGCPRGILELLNSRACRGAIMFNDELSREECEGLLRRLSGCAFPFQCAHGRPSMVPISELGGLGSWEKTVEKANNAQLWEDWLERRKRRLEYR
jgi:DNA mismatch repair protein MLH3